MHPSRTRKTQSPSPLLIERPLEALCDCNKKGVHHQADAFFACSLLLAVRLVFFLVLLRRLVLFRWLGRLVLPLAFLLLFLLQPLLLLVVSLFKLLKLLLLFLFKLLLSLVGLLLALGVGVVPLSIRIVLLLLPWRVRIGLLELLPLLNLLLLDLLALLILFITQILELLLLLLVELRIRIAVIARARRRRTIVELLGIALIRVALIHICRAVGIARIRVGRWIVGRRIRRAGVSLSVSLSWPI